MTSKRRHLFSALGLSALSVLCFALLAWALFKGSIVASFPNDGRVQSNTAGHQYMRVNTAYSRAETPARYWTVVGLLGFWGSLFAVVAVLEFGSYRVTTDSRKGGAPSPFLLARFDRACRLYPDRRDVLLRARAILIDLNSPAVEAALDRFLNTILSAPDQEAALLEIDEMAKVLHRFGKLYATGSF